MSPRTDDLKDRAPRTGLNSLVPLLTEVGDLKRIRVAHAPGSLSEQQFRRAWSMLLAGDEPRRVALRETARAVAAARLGGVDAAVLRQGGLTTGEAASVLRRSFDSVGGPLPEALRRELQSALEPEDSPECGEDVADAAGGLPAFAKALARQPRAGCTRPGSPRLILEPPETHAEHCATVAVYATLLCGHFGGDPAAPFLAGLAHHLHNAALPDSGFTGEMLLGEHLEAVISTLRFAALDELGRVGELRSAVEGALELLSDAASPEARSFHAADVIDRVLQMRHYDRQASFTLDQALEEMELVHEGPLKDFHETVLSEADLS